jgi:hypothetical protein
MTARARLFLLFALGFAGAAAFHAVAVVARIDATPRWRHGLFVAIDLALAGLMIRRPRWFVWVFALLLVQQAWSHGTSLVAHARAGGVDVASVVTLVALPVVLILLIVDARATLGRGSAADRR